MSRKIYVNLLVTFWVLLSQPIFAASFQEVIDQHRGQVVLVDFWASWCGPCLRSFPWLNEMQAKYRSQGLVVLGINVDEDRTDADEFINKLNPQFRIIFDDAVAWAEFFEVETMPSSYVLDPSGRIVVKHRGFNTKTAPEFEEQLSAVLEKYQSQVFR